MLIQVGHFSSIVFAFISLLIRVSQRSGGLKHISEKERPQVLLPKRKFVYNACWLELYLILGVIHVVVSWAPDIRQLQSLAQNLWSHLSKGFIRHTGQMGCTKTGRLHEIIPSFLRGLCPSTVVSIAWISPYLFSPVLAIWQIPMSQIQQPEVAKKVLPLDGTQLLWDSIFHPKRHQARDGRCLSSFFF